MTPYFAPFNEAPKIVASSDGTSKDEDDDDGLEEFIMGIRINYEGECTVN